MLEVHPSKTDSSEMEVSQTPSSSHGKAISCSFQNLKEPSSSRVRNSLLSFTSSTTDNPCKVNLRISANSTTPRARFVARRTETLTIQQLQKPLSEYMSLPESQYSILDAERIERVDENTFRCYVYRFKVLNYEVCPVLLVRIEEQPNGCCIQLLSCQLEGSPSVAAQSEKLEASAVNQISCGTIPSDSAMQQLTSETVIEISVDVPPSRVPIPVGAIEAAGTQVLEQMLKIMLPRFMGQLVKDYTAWAAGEMSRQHLADREA